LALAVPLSRFTSQVGGGSAFFVRRHYTIMKTSPFIAMLVCLGVLACQPSFAQETNKTSAGINFVNVEPARILDIYKAETKRELIIASNVRLANHHITLHFHGLSEAVPALIEQALLKQAGIVITSLDDKRASVTYNDQLKLQP
jgi:hypothetical protein